MPFPPHVVAPCSYEQHARKEFKLLVFSRAPCWVVVAQGRGLRGLCMKGEACAYIVARDGGEERKG
jgi:hypothetical protein